jgi:osmoprotectant transport system permease protein
LETLIDAYSYALENAERFWRAFGRHLMLSGVALAVSILVGVPLGILIARRVRLAQGVIAAIGTLRLIPSLAVLFLVLPYLGLGVRPALFALTLLALPPVLINTYAGLRGVAPQVLEAARGVGMSAGQSLRRVELPLGLPAILAGVRIAAVETIASATLASFINGGGLGEFIQIGFALNKVSVMLVGAIPVTALALGAELFFDGAQWAVGRWTGAALGAPLLPRRDP